MLAPTKLSPRITTMIRMDHTHVLTTFHKYKLDAAPDKKKALVETISTAIEIHARLEEEIFYPAMRHAVPEAVDKSFPEHNEMRRLISTLRSMDPSQDDYDVAFMELMRTIIHHVADEETILLPEAERVMPERLEELGWQMTRRRFELAGPRAGQIAVNTMRSYPGVVAAAVALVAVGGYLAYRESTKPKPSRVADAMSNVTSLPDRFQRMMTRRKARSLAHRGVDRLVKRPATRLLSYAR